MKFSVLLPTRNRLDLLSRAIETVRRQDYEDWEIVVSDNCSEDDVAGHVRSLNDARIKYVRTERFIPVTDNWNNALAQSDGDYVIMLGDDDCLMKGYFSTAKRLIETYAAPDSIYTSAFLYAYPGVMPGVPEGFLKTFTKEKIFQGAREPFWLPKGKVKGYIRESLNLRAPFYYNMQFSLVSRKLIDAMKGYGAFYQSPYPDFYASNAIMLKAKRILVVPEPLVTIGISPKSFGYYYYNDAESTGDEFLNNLPRKDMVSRLQEVILPGIAMNTSYLIAMETLAVNLGGEFGLKVNYARYRFIQVLAVFEGHMMGKNAGKAYEQLKQKMRLSDWLRGILLALIGKLVPKPLRRYALFFIYRMAGSHIGGPMPEVVGKFNTILDVFEQVDPKHYSPSGIT